VENNWIDKIAEEMMDSMAQPEKEFVQAMMDIVERHGKLANDDGKGIWVGYVEASENEVAARGIKCLNCAHYEGDGVCHIVLQSVEPEGLCRLAAIPDGIVRLNDMMS
jgi:hypothetical protein